MGKLGSLDSSIDLAEHGLELESSRRVGTGDWGEREREREQIRLCACAAVRGRGRKVKARQVEEELPE
jgi:hypothetical protein